MTIIKAILAFLAGSKAQVLNSVGTGGMGLYLANKVFETEGEQICFTMTEAGFFLLLVYIVLQSGLRQIKHGRK